MCKKILISALFATGMMAGSMANAATVALQSDTVIDSVTTIGDASHTDFRWFDSSVVKAGGTGQISDVTADNTIGTGGLNEVGYSWTSGSPTETGTNVTSDRYIGTGVGFGTDMSTFEQFDITMTSTDAIINIYYFNNGNTGSQDWTASFGGVSNNYSVGDSNITNHLLSYSVSGATIGEVLTFRLDNISGTNDWHNMGILAANVTNNTPTATPIPAAAWLFGTGIAGLVGVSKRKKAKAAEAIAV